jgi:hypothetical protein
VNKKEAKKTLFTVDFGANGATARSKQKFFASFFQKRSAFFPSFPAFPYDAIIACKWTPSPAKIF